MRLNKISLAVMLLGGTMFLVACGGSDDPAPAKSVVTAVPVVGVFNAISGPTLVAAVVNKDFGFTSGVPAFGTATPTTLKLLGAGSAPSFNISSTEGTAAGVMTFGSCIFTIGSGSTYPATSPLGSGKTITVNPCSVSVSAPGAPADGTTTGGTASFVLGTTLSERVNVSVTISSTGVLTIPNPISGQPPITIGTATVAPATGTGS